MFSQQMIYHRLMIELWLNSEVLSYKSVVIALQGQDITILLYQYFLSVESFISYISQAITLKSLIYFDCLLYYHLYSFWFFYLQTHIFPFHWLKLNFLISFMMAHQDLFLIFGSSYKSIHLFSLTINSFIPPVLWEILITLSNWLFICLWMIKLACFICTSNIQVQCFLCQR